MGTQHALRRGDECHLIGLPPLRFLENAVEAGDGAAECRSGCEALYQRGEAIQAARGSIAKV